MRPSTPLEDITRGSCISCLFSGQVFEGHIKIGKRQLKGRFLIHKSAIHIRTGEDVAKFRSLSSGPFLDLGLPVVFNTPEKYDTIMNGRFENWCFHLVRNWFMGNQKNRDYFNLVTVLYASVKDVKLEPSVVGLVWAISQLETGEVKPFTDILRGFNPTDMDAWFNHNGSILISLTDSNKSRCRDHHQTLHLYLHHHSCHLPYLSLTHSIHPILSVYLPLFK